MLLTHRKAREDLNDGREHKAPAFSPLKVIQALHMAHGRSPIKTAKKALPR
ncbi:hypothetical protein U5817_09850 [Aromatoleum evansii]|uniref:Uncharacterized protein n=1 Tax=Aromatoleum evansii TaxID=59406 RepID=A0ABZ1AR42_AROEV|nr:hypothetical protein U5817_09500 [Aromatoleum evansii]WRL48329.1 hypothetical protein U5817_09850 [Aromatoleum evansii]